MEPGRTYPLGATPVDGGVNFSVLSREATSIELLLFDRPDDGVPSRVLRLDPLAHRVYHYWNAFVPGLRAGQLYGYRVDGPWEPERGLRFDPAPLLIDPYARALAQPERRRQEGIRSQNDHATAMKSVVVDPGAYDWEGDRPPQRSWAETILYELHVGGFTAHPSSGLAARQRGTYAGLIEKIPYLLELGITAVELLPVFAFDVHDAPAGRTNYWGYSPIAFFAPHPPYSSDPDPIGVIDEFRDMVKALHRAGIEVILDVVFNHTAEGNASGPTLSYRGLADRIYYLLERDTGAYRNYSGCGNTLNGNESICRRLILDSLRYWVSEMHVDGFRFDLASVLARDAEGQPLADPPVLWDIETDPILCNVKLIAEAWDAAGLYQVGSFIGDSWVEWNGRFRDDVRTFIKGDQGRVGALASRLCGSPDLYEHEQREPEQSINFITCHDGFTLWDLVSYNRKHNEANGENNRDGCNENASWNCGVEGDSEDPEVLSLRERQIRNLLALTLLSVGTPMLLMGDEACRSQQGNNNAYCQDNPTSWFDWTLITRHAGLHRFVRKLIALRRGRRLSAERQRMSLAELLRHQPFHWHGVRLNQPDWSPSSHSLATSVQLQDSRIHLHLMVNAYWQPLDFEIPGHDPQRHRWHRCIDTSLPSPHDIHDIGAGPLLEAPLQTVRDRSLVLLVAWGGLSSRPSAHPQEGHP